MRRRWYPAIGSDFEDYLREQGQLESATALAIKRVFAWQLSAAMKRGKVSKAELARRMKTSRAVVHRLLDESDSSVTLATISKAAAALGRNVTLELAA
jgi:DNA-binding Xre family transcriptional regulator